MLHYDGNWRNGANGHRVRPSDNTKHTKGENNGSDTYPANAGFPSVPCRGSRIVLNSPAYNRGVVTGSLITYSIYRSTCTTMKIDHNLSITRKDLPTILGCSEGTLWAVIRRRAHFYQTKTIAKEGSKPRTVHKTQRPLRGMLDRVKTEILDKVTYPSHLHGSLRKRSTKTNAEVHLGAAVAVKYDIANFFPSITAKHVFCIFYRGFHFPKDVSSVLAMLLTTPYENSPDGILPQGAPTSPHIANLVFFNNEPAILKKMESRGYCYTRYVDDITVTSRSSLAKGDKTWIIKTLRDLIVPMNMKPGERKIKIQNKSTHKIITGLKVGGKIKIPQEYVDMVIAEITMLGGLATGDREKAIRSIKSKVGYVKSKDPKAGRYLAIRLSRVTSANK